MNVLDYLESHPLLTVLVVWPIVTGVLSAFYGYLDAHVPRLTGALRAVGLDLPGLLRVIFSAAKSKGIGPKDPPEPPTAGTGVKAALTVFGLALAGCGAARELEHVAQASSVVIERAEPCLVSQYEQAQRACLNENPNLDKAEACVAKVRKDYDPIEKALADLRAARCALEPAKCEASK